MNFINPNLAKFPYFLESSQDIDSALQSFFLFKILSFGLRLCKEVPTPPFCFGSPPMCTIYKVSIDNFSIFPIVQFCKPQHFFLKVQFSFQFEVATFSQFLQNFRKFSDFHQNKKLYSNSKQTGSFDSFFDKDIRFCS